MPSADQVPVERFLDPATQQVARGWIDDRVKCPLGAPQAKAVEIEIDDWRRVEREHLAHDKTSNDRDPKRLLAILIVRLGSSTLLVEPRPAFGI
jgi:hypothetical protein